MSLSKAFKCPTHPGELSLDTNGNVICKSGDCFCFLDADKKVIDFVLPKTGTVFDDANRAMYDSPASIEVYRNFLDWLFATFNQDEASFRNQLINKLELSPGDRVLVTGCGFGDDIELIYNIVGDTGEIHAQDLSKAMVLAASSKRSQDNIMFSVSSALDLPYQSDYFDAVYHFGGINLFGDVKKAISEMERVCKTNGVVLFGDEGIAPHLRGTQYAEIAISNNSLWETTAPIDLLPDNAKNIELSYVLGNCFYIIKFTPAAGLPEMNLDIPHKGLRGGTARTRYFGRVEGLTSETKDALINEAKNRQVSVHALMEEAVKNILT